MKALLPEITPATLRADAMAGLLGAILALPQGIAFAKLAGLPPQYGIYSAIVPCAVAAIFGSSHHVVSGPTNANSLALFAALTPLAAAGSPPYIALAITVTALVGIAQLALGVFRLAWITDFIAPAVLLGFISGAAILIGLYALPDVLGVSLAGGHGGLGVLAHLPAMAANYNLTAVLISATTLATTIVTAQISRKLPFMLVGIMAGLAISELLKKYPHLPSVTRIGVIPSVLPLFSIPSAPLSVLPDLVSIVGALSIVALGQSVSIAKVLAQRSGQRLDVDREFVGQGLSNIAGSLFSCYVSCGSLNRSMPNFIAGARTGMAALLSAVFLLGLASVTRPLLEQIPMPAIGALLVYIAIGLIDVRGFVHLARLNRADLTIAVTTLVSMLFLPFQQAILIGTGMSLILYLQRTSHPAVRVLLPDPTTPARIFTPLEDLELPTGECPQLKLVRIEGAVYFGAASFISQRLHDMRSGSTQKHLLLMAKSMNFIDLSGADVWEHELKARRANGGDLYFHRPRASVRKAWRESGFETRLRTENIFDSKRTAITSIYRKLDKTICATCPVRAFAECRDIRDLSANKADEDERLPNPANFPRACCSPA